MKIKFLGATEAEDRIVEIPDGTTEVQVEMPDPEPKRDLWPSVILFIAFMAWVFALVWVFRG